MPVNIKIHNGIRYGDYELGGIKGTLPTHAITSKHREYAKLMGKDSFDFGTNMIEIIEESLKRIVSEPVYRKERIHSIKAEINENKGMLCLLVFKREKSITITKSDNISLIDFQIECGFVFIKAYFSRPTTAISELIKYRKKMTEEHHLVPVLDENLKEDVFADLYTNIYNDEAELVAFLGRRPTMTDSIRRNNLRFIAERDSDQIIRLASFINKSSEKVVGSLARQVFGFDAFSFMSKSGGGGEGFIPQLQIYKELGFVDLTEDSNVKCVVTGNDLYMEVTKYSEALAPIYIHDMVMINLEFLNLHKNYTKEELWERVNHRFWFSISS